jgi:hypothetical protein
MTQRLANAAHATEGWVEERHAITCASIGGFTEQPAEAALPFDAFGTR